MSRALIVEDDPSMASFLREALAGLGLESVHASNLEQARKHFRDHAIRLVLLDRRLEGDKESLGFCLELKKDPRTRAIPIVVLTSLDEFDEQLKSYRFGADLFLQKKPEVLGRLGEYLKTFLDRLPYKEEAKGRLSCGALSIDLNERAVRIGASDFRGLPPKHFELLVLLAGAHGSVVSREALLKKLWDGPVRDKEVDVLVSRLKSRLGPAGSIIESVRGQGYRLAAAAPEA